MDIRTIVVPLDGSPLAERALPFVAMIARRADACVRVVAVVPGAGFVGPMDVPGAISQRLHEARASLQQYVDGVVGHLRADADVRATGQVRVDTPVDGILKAAVERDADLIVLTTHGRGGFRRAILGSVTDALLRRAPMPVLVVNGVPDDVVADLGEEPLLDSVVIPLDGSVAAEAALGPGYEMARLLEVPPVLLRVVTPRDGGTTLVPPVDPVPGDAPTALADEYLRSVAQRPDAMDVRPRAIVIHDDVAASAIVGFCAGCLAVIASHGHGGVKRLLLGSVADKVVRMSDYPVLLVRPGIQEGEIEAIWRANAGQSESAFTAAGTVAI